MARFDRLEEGRAKKTKEDYAWFRRFYTDWMAELEEWLRLAELQGNTPEGFDEWLETVEEEIRECLNRRVLH